MSQTLKLTLKNLFTEDRIILLILVTLSISSFIYFFQKDQLLLYGDSLSRMNISRKIIDNLTPGFAQLGNVWLPLPQIAMLPLTWNKYLWQSGIAGAAISMTSYIIGGIYLYKTAKILTNSFLASLLSLSIYALNINLLYLQTTAMSETIFLCSISAAIYYFVLWMKSGNRMHNLLFAGIAINAASLIRYEALALLIASIPMVFFYVRFNTRQHNLAESSTILYATLASLGFLCWTIYLAIIFGDPLYWKNFYASDAIRETDQGIVSGFRYNLSFIEATWSYLKSVIWMTGLIPVILSFISLPFIIYKSIKQRSFYFLPIFLSTAIFLFMILTLQRNTPINQPDLNLSTILNQSTFEYPEFNIRYGILMLPMIALLSSYLLSLRPNVIKIIVFSIISIQFFTYYNPVAAIIFQLPRNIEGNITQGTPRQKEMIKWLKQNYHNDGLIMISALKHDPQMLQLGADYKTYIHEGTDKYWKESTKNPQRYATWVVLDSWNDSDQVTKFLKDNPNLDLYFNRVYDKDGMWIYKIKTKPDIEIKN